MKWCWYIHTISLSFVVKLENIIADSSYYYMAVTYDILTSGLDAQMIYSLSSQRSQ